MFSADFGNGSRSLAGTSSMADLEDGLGLETLIICPPNLVSMWEDCRDQYRLRAKTAATGVPRPVLSSSTRPKLTRVGGGAAPRRSGSSHGALRRTNARVARWGCVLAVLALNRRSCARSGGRKKEGLRPEAGRGKSFWAQPLVCWLPLQCHVRHGTKVVPRFPLNRSLTLGGLTSEIRDSCAAGAPPRGRRARKDPPGACAAAAVAMADR